MKKNRLSLLAYMCYVFIMLAVIIVILAITSGDNARTEAAGGNDLIEVESSCVENQAAMVGEHEVRKKTCNASCAREKITYP